MGVGPGDTCDANILIVRTHTSNWPPLNSLVLGYQAPQPKPSFVLNIKSQSKAVIALFAVTTSKTGFAVFWFRVQCKTHESSPDNNHVSSMLVIDKF